MIGSIVETYQKAMLGIVGKFGDIDNIAMENGFLDEGFISTQIKRIKEELHKVSEELKQVLEFEKQSDYTKEKVNSLQSKREKNIFKFVYLASNSFKSLEMCITMLKEYPYDFVDCIQALVEHKSGNEEKAFQLLESYYIEKGSVEGHYLINKIFGILLMKRKEFESAIQFLRYSARFMPEDIELHKYLFELYDITGNETGKKVEEEIICLLG